MTAQEILEGITRHRANPLRTNNWGDVNDEDVARKIPEIEWALQAIAEKLCELEAKANG